MKQISIIIVAYQNLDCLAECLASMPNDPTVEIIVVNNTHQNRGFGAGCNLGAEIAKGKYLVFVNPDVIAPPGSINRLVAELEQDPKIGMVGPALTNAKGEIQASTSRQPTKFSAPIVYSFLNRWLAGTNMVKRHWYIQEKPRPRQVGIVSGAAFGMRRAVFDEIGQFDPKFFLYWEEVDLAKRCLAAGYQVVYRPEIKLTHHGALSTVLPKGITMNWFRESRYRFFAKHFGVLYGLLLEGWLALSEHWQLSLVLVGLTWVTHSVGAIIVATMIYNEIEPKWGKSMAGLIGLGLGLVMGSFQGYWLIVGVGWMLVDLTPPLSRWRSVYVVSAIGAGLWLA